MLQIESAWCFKQGVIKVRLAGSSMYPIYLHRPPKYPLISGIKTPSLTETPQDLFSVADVALTASDFYDLRSTLNATTAAGALP